MIYPGCSLGKILKLERRPVEIIPDKKYAEIGIYCFGKGIFHKEPRSGLEVGNKKLFQIKEGDLILQVTFAWEGAVGLASKKEDGMHGSTRFPTFRVKEDLCYPSFLLNYFKTKEGREQLIKISPGSAGRNRVLSLKRIHEVMIPLPPIDEQRRIMARIEELAARIEEARKLRRRAVEEAEALLMSVSRSIFNFEKKSIITIDALVGRANLKNGLSVKSMDVESRVRCLRVSAIRGGEIDCSDSKPIPMKENEVAQYLVKDKDVFIVRGNGSKNLVGRAGVVKNVIPGIIFPDLFIRVPLDSRIILPEFFVSWWNSKTMRDSIETTAKTTSGIWKINQGHIASFSIPLPGLEEQQRVIAYLEGLQSKLDALRRHQTETAAALEAMLPAVLERAFRGEL